MAKDLPDSASQTLDDGPASQKKDDKVAYWLGQIDDARKREKTWRKEAARVIDIYEGQRENIADGGTMDFNILFANTETLSPAIYNSVPRPVVQQRFKDENPVAEVAAKVMQRTLEFLIDQNNPNESAFDDLQKTAVLEALLPGRGLSRFKYDAEIITVPLPEGAPKGTVPEEQVESETVCGQEVPWDRVYYGYGKRWSQIPWQAFEHFMTRQECIANFGPEVGGRITLTAVAKEDGDKEEAGPADAEGTKFAHIYEIWNKKTKKVIFVSDGYPTFVKEIDDPAKLVGFFPAPRPIAFLTKVKSLVPQTLYLMYESQARELNDVTMRIGKITRALKVRGFYDGTIKGLENLLSQPDNTLLSAEGVAAMQQGMTLEKSIWLMPLEKLIAVLQQLYINRQQVLQVIYQITGVADIMRGSSQASETLGAQKMKEAWGTMRLKRMQKEVQRFVRDSLRIMAELAALNFSKETFAKMTGIKLLSQEEKQQAEAEGQQRMQAYQQQMAAMPPPQPGMPPAQVPQPPKMPPELQALMDLPTWEEVLALLSDNILRNFNVDIETNSTVDAEATEDKQFVAEYMNALSQFLNGIAPIVEKGFMPFEVAKTMLLSVTKRFRFGVEVEDSIKKMSAPAQPAGGPDPKAAAEAESLKQQTEFAAKKNQLDLARQENDNRLAAAQNQAKMEQIAMQKQLSEAKFNAEMQKLGFTVQIAQTQAATAEQVGAAKVAEANAPKPAPAAKKD